MMRRKKSSLSILFVCSISTQNELKKGITQHVLSNINLPKDDVSQTVKEEFKKIIKGLKQKREKMKVLWNIYIRPK